MPSSFGFDKLVSINKSLVFTILSELNTEESVSCCGIRGVFGHWITLYMYPIISNYIFHRLFDD